MKDLILPPSYGNRLSFPWLLMYRRGGEWGPPFFFLSHGRNWAKWDSEEKKREGFEITGHIKEREDAVVVCKKANEKIKSKKTANYQTTGSTQGVNLKGFKK